MRTTAIIGAVKIDRDTVGSTTPEPKGSFNWRRLRHDVIIGTLIAVILLGAGAGYLWKYVNDKVGAAQEEIAVDPLPVGQAYNVLVIGSDRRDVVEGNDRSQRPFKGGGGKRADTMMIIHVREDGTSAVGLSFPRDLRVHIPGQTGWHRLNAAYNGGPDLVIKTIKALTGMDIHHYVEVNFSSFRRIVDAVGGLRMCVTRGYDDPQSGLKLAGKGCYNFDGNRALAFVRMRKSDPEGDFGRIKRQQLFMRTLMTKVKGIGINVPRLVKTVQAVSSGLIIDKELGISEMRGIANRLAGFGQANVDFRIVPSRPQTIGGTAYVVMRDAEAKAIFAALIADVSVEKMPPFGKTGLSIPSPSDVRVLIRNGTGIGGFGRTIANELKAKGYVIRDVAEADRDDHYTTTIAYFPGAELKATLLAELFPNAKLSESVDVGSRQDVILTLGDDAWIARRSASPSPGAG
jgi:LCP family protein required for cell wall assembly